MVVFFTAQIDKFAVGDMIGGFRGCLCKADRNKKQEDEIAYEKDVNNIPGVARGVDG
jgi:hypothetical protein